MGWAFLAWALKHGVRHLHIDPGQPTQSAYFESFNGHLRAPCANMTCDTSVR